MLRCAQHDRGPIGPNGLFNAAVIVDDGAFDLFDQVGDVDAARAGIGAVEDGAAAPHAITLAENGETFGGSLVAAVEDEAVSIHNRGRADPVGVAPDRGTRASTRAAE